MEVWICRNVSPDVSTEDHRGGAPRISEYIITFQVSTGKSASLKLQSNCSFASGSSEGSWYGATYSCARASVAVIRFRGSKTSILSKRSRATTETSDFERKKERKRWRTRFISCFELLRERHPLPLRQTLDKSQGILRSDGGDNIIRWRAEQFGDDRELVDVCQDDINLRSEGLIDHKHSRSLPGNKGFPSSISAKIQPVLHMST